MKLFLIALIGAALLLSDTAVAQKNLLTASKPALIFSKAKGAESKPDTLILSALATVKIKEISVRGEYASYFKVASTIPKQVTPQKKESVIIIFNPFFEFSPGNFGKV